MNFKNPIKIVLISMALFCLACCGEKEKEIWPPPKNQSMSFEVIGKDTCNREKYGYRQGKWIIPDSAKLRLGKWIAKDTIVYRNDTIIN